MRHVTTDMKISTVLDKTFAARAKSTLFFSYNAIFPSICFFFLVFKLHILKCLLRSFFFLLPVIFENNLTCMSIHRDKTIATLFDNYITVKKYSNFVSFSNWFEFVLIETLTDHNFCAFPFKSASQLVKKLGYQSA